MSWVMFDDALQGRLVVELQPTAVEVFRERTTDTVRVHLALLQIGIEGPDPHGGYTVQLSSPGGRNGTRLTVDAQAWMRVWPWVEQVRQAQYAVAGAVPGYGPPPGGGLPPGYAPPPGYVGPPPGVVDP